MKLNQFCTQGKFFWIKDARDYEQETQTWSCANATQITMWQGKQWYQNGTKFSYDQRISSSPGLVTITWSKNDWKPNVYPSNKSSSTPRNSVTKGSLSTSGPTYPQGLLNSQVLWGHKFLPMIQVDSRSVPCSPRNKSWSCIYISISACTWTRSNPWHLLKDLAWRSLLSR